MSPFPRFVALALAAGVLLSVTLPAPAAAETHEIAEAKVTATLPEGFTVEKDENVVIALDAAKELTVMFWLGRVRQLDTAREMLEPELARIVQKAEPDGRPSRGPIGEMDSFQLAGAGEVEGSRVRWSLAAIATPAKKVLFVLGVVEERKRAAQEPVLRKILEGIRPVVTDP